MSNFSKERRAALLAGLCALSAVPSVRAAQNVWPTKPLRIIVGFPAGSAPDMQARLIADPLARILGQPVVIENKPGASGNIGADMTAKARDGHTIGVIGNGPLTSSQFLYDRLPYNPRRDLAPVGTIGLAPLVWVASAQSASPREFIQWARERQDRTTYGSIGSGSGSHLGMEVVNDALGLKARHIPYNGGPPVVNALLGSQVDMALLPGSSVLPLIRQGKLYAIGVTSAERSPSAPELLSMRELGAPLVNVEVWNAIMAPATLPPAHQEQLAAALAKVLGTEVVMQKLSEFGWQVGSAKPQELAQRIDSDTVLYGELIQRLGVKLD
ncbi:Bug family tripartite tricarboxylate transporter substrate binding protein [Pigmentiphaga kullae]|uniref:Tripartite-type tricarboxylate transporter receptor subunit TctC n=1 Tax=Pigmentiphaga kullae TaxID=151784 RepID=A0A4Q7NN80_9BURK|nr:tripartite tricarboxylate transporter substrate binding protein [Pigmentiphaga kullae]RZS86603.1 tripartite-type tricarboxylate transporter receptor subunit TctC [Pigmentiphaga kullae]